MKTLLLLCALILSILSSGQTNFLQKYAGSYYATASYADYKFVDLKADGTCRWTYTWDNKGKSQSQEKFGKWTATAGYIRISLDNGIGTIVEIYVMKNQEFVNRDDSNRFLTKIERI
jgi:hypothetical protein